MKNNSAPGIDGFTAGWSKMFWSRLKIPFMNMVQEAQQKETLGQTLRQGLVCLLPKGDKDCTNLNNWHPITLLSNFYKILSGTYAALLTDALTNIIHPSQTAYLQGRQMTDTICTVYQILLHTKIKHINGIMLLVDFKKAFDTVHHQYLFNALHAFGFGEKFIQAIKLLLNDRFSEVTIGGHSTKSYSLERGVPQGDPISAYLFIVVIEVLATKLRKTNLVKRIKVGKVDIEDQFYADDSTLFIGNNETSLRNTLKILHDFGETSGLKINITKTKAIYIGDSIDNPPICKDLKIEWDTVFTLLGIIFDNKLKLLEINFQEVWGVILDTMQLWKRRTTTVIGRLPVFKCLLLSKLTHYAVILPTLP